MESNVCGSENPPMDAENANLNEATPAVIPIPAEDLPKEATGVVECDDAISSTTPDKFVEDLAGNASSLMTVEPPTTSSETDADFFSSELSICGVPTEKITENVEDIVQDLENLLGESNDSYRFSRESFDNSKLAESYDEVNSSNVTDLFATEQSNLEGPSYHCSIIPDVSDLGVTPSDNVESVFKGIEINEPSVLEINEPSGLEKNQPSALEINEPPALELNDPSALQINEPSVLHLKKPSVLEINEPPALQINEPSALEINEPPALELNDPSALQINEPSVLHLKKPSVLEINEPPALQINEPSALQINEPPALEINDPSALQINEPSALQINEPSALQIKEPFVLEINEPPALQIKEPSALQINEPPALEINYPSALQINETSALQINKPSALQLNEPAALQIKEPAVLEINQPPALQINEPSALHLNEPSALQIKEPAVLEINEPPALQINEPSALQLNEPSALQIKEPSVLEINEPPTLQINEPSALQINEPSALQINEPSVLEINDPSVLEINELPVLEMHDSSVLEIKEPAALEMSEPPALETVQTAEGITMVCDLEGTLKDAVSTPAAMDILETVGEVDTIINFNTLIESQTEFETIRNENISLPDATNSEDLIKTDILKPETETVKEDSINEGLANNENIKVIPNFEPTEICENSQLEQDDSFNVDEIVCVQPCESAAELLEELIKESNSANIDSVCVENLLDDNSKSELKEIEGEEKGEASLQDYNNEVVQDLSGKPEDNPNENEEVAQIPIENDPLGQTPVSNVEEGVDEKAERSPEVGNQLNAAIDESDFQKIITETSEAIAAAPELKATEEPEAKSEQESPDASINEENVTAGVSAELEDQSTVSTKLAQPLTVEVEVSEQQLPVITTQEHTPEEAVASKEAEKVEVLESNSDLKQLPSADEDTNPSSRAPLKMTITKHKSDNVHSILKIYDPTDVEIIPKMVIKSTPTSTTNDDPEEQAIPKITIKSLLAAAETQHSPRLTIKPIKPPVANQEDKQSSPKSVKAGGSGTGNPRITIKPIVKPESLSPLKLTLRPYPKLEEVPSSPKLNIKPIVKPMEEAVPTETHHSPKITIKPILKPPEETETFSEEKHSPRIIIKPIVKPVEEGSQAEERHSPRITIKPVIKPPEEPVKEDEERHSPRITIKPVVKHADDEPKEEKHSPRITIKPIIKPHENQETLEERHSPKVTIKPVKKPLEEDDSDDRQNLRITIKPVIKQEEIQGHAEERHSPRITIKPVVKPPVEATKEEPSEDRPSPRITIKPVIKPEEDIQSYPEEKHSPRITIKPIVKPPQETIKEETPEEKHSPRITIKPVIKLAENETESTHSPRITIKPVVKPPEDSKQIDEMSVIPVQPFKLNIKPIVKPPECSPSPKVTIKPVPKPPEADDEPVELIDFEDQIKQERIVLKIAKNTKREKELKKIKVKLSKERGVARILPTACEGRLKRSSTDDAEQELKHFKSELPSDLTISLVSSTASTTHVPDVTITRIEGSSDVKQEESSSSSPKSVPKQNDDIQQMSSFFPAEEMPDPLADIPVFEITLETANAMSSAPPRPATTVTPAAGVPPAPRKRGRPRKVPLEVREEFKDPKEEEVPPPVVEESTRPKRSCRGASVKATLGIKPRKPRAPSTRGRGGKKTVSTRATAAKKPKERKSSSKLKLPKELMVKDQPEFKEFEAKDAEFKQVPLPAETGNREVVIYEEETRMSAENSSRAQTPAKQVLVSSSEVVEESQSSIQSNTTTESGEKTQKSRKGPRLEVHQEPEGEVISADKLAEYSWGGGGPYMLQEQVAQFVGIKSFKRKYPGIHRRTVDMQERDFIRESCLASEAMCDMGLTAVRSEDILDIMYTDFQHKYEEYCKHQRDRQAKDVSNKQKALSLAASQEKNKLDIVEQAVQSAFQWNANFNKARREQRRACMDLQTFTVHFPKGKMKQVNKPPIGHYPLGLVPGQFTDYYKKYNSHELTNLPLHTMGCKAVSISSASQDTEESQSDGSGSDSDSSSSDSDSSDSSSGAEDCKMCAPTAHASKKMLVH